MNRSGRSRRPLVLGLALLALGCRGAEQTASEPVRPSRAALEPPEVWTPLNMQSARAYHDAASLDAGRVLVCGGRRTQGAATQYLDSCELFNAATGAFTPAESLGFPRAFLTLTSAGPGRVYAVGGEEPSAEPPYRGELWLFTATASGTARSTQKALLSGRSRHTASWLPTARALAVVGGFDGTLVARDEVAPANAAGVLGNFATVSPPSERGNHTATVLASGEQLLVAGGGDPNNPAIINNSVRLLTVPASGSPSWKELKALPGAGLADHSATLLDDGRVLVAGGRPFPGGPTDQALRYDASGNGEPLEAASLQTATFAHAAILLQGKVIVTGGDTGTGVTDRVEVYDPVQNVWFSLKSMNVARRNHAITLLDDRRALVTGGTGTDRAATDSAEILSPRLRGEPCTPDGLECLTGYCVDGVCCEQACDGSCERCDQEGSLGTCKTVSGEPVGDRSCPGGLFCSDGACLDACSDSRECRADLHCNDGKCEARLPLRSRCAESRDCVSGVPCVDGYCCDSACDGICEACGEQGSAGKCVPVRGTPRGARPTCGEPSGECGLTCDGAQRTECNYVASGEGCGEDKCEAGRVTQRSTCDGFGNCGAVAEECKGAFACASNGRSCRSDCSSDADCASNAYTCDPTTAPGVCVFKGDVGKSCKVDTECSDGLVCTDGVCCAEKCQDDTWSCALEGHAGVCKKRPGEQCASPADCGSDFCVLGICCESECSGQCETCAAQGHAGECRPQLGDPEPRRPPCDETGELCAQRSCDGLDNAESRGSCRGFRNVGVSCEPARCDENSFVGERRCSASGSCAESSPQPCWLYACTNAGCRESCATDADCADDAGCRDGRCVADGAYCMGDSLLAPNQAAQSCAPYACAIDRCLTECSISDHCSDGFACDDVTRRCLKIEGGAEDGCGCSVPGSRKSAPPSLALLLLAAGSLLRRQRKSSAVTALIKR